MSSWCCRNRQRCSNVLLSSADAVEIVSYLGFNQLFVKRSAIRAYINLLALLNSCILSILGSTTSTMVRLTKLLLASSLVPVPGVTSFSKPLFNASCGITRNSIAVSYYAVILSDNLLTSYPSRSSPYITSSSIAAVTGVTSQRPIDTDCVCACRPPFEQRPIAGIFKLRSSVWDLPVNDQRTLGPRSCSHMFDAVGCGYSKHFTTASRHHISSCLSPTLPTATNADISDL